MANRRAILWLLVLTGFVLVAAYPVSGPSVTASRQGAGVQWGSTPVATATMYLPLVLRDFSLPPSCFGPTVHGYVTLPTGEGVQGVTIHILLGDRHAVVETDQQGYYLWSIIGGGIARLPLRVWPEHPGYTFDPEVVIRPPGCHGVLRLDWTAIPSHR